MEEALNLSSGRLLDGDDDDDDDSVYTNPSYFDINPYAPPPHTCDSNLCNRQIANQLNFFKFNNCLLNV